MVCGLTRDFFGVGGGEGWANLVGDFSPIFSFFFPIFIISPALLLKNIGEGIFQKVGHLNDGMVERSSQLLRYAGCPSLYCNS